MKKNAKKEASILEFWNWFEVYQNRLQSDKITNELIIILNNKISLLGDFGWEIREGSSKNNMLIISPSGKAKLLNDTKAIIELAPELDEWEFLYFKPAKNWDYCFSIDEIDSKRMIDASQWQYVLLKYHDDYEIIIKADTLKVIPEEYHMIAVDIVLESILGEELSLTLISEVDLVNEFPKEYIDKQSSIKDLKKQIFELEKLD